MKNCIAFVEHDGGAVRRLALELATKAGDLAQELGGASAAIVVGPGAGKAADALKATPVDTIYVAEDTPADKFLIDPVVDVVERVLREAGPTLALFPATNGGKDVAARIGARLGAGVITEATEISAAGGKVSVVSPKFGGSVTTTIAFTGGDYGVVLCRANSFAARDAAGKGQIVHTPAPSGKQYAATIAERMPAEAATLGVDEAGIVVSGGRGLGGPEHFKMIEELAAALGGAVGASRAVVDAGWISHSHQVGQTGKTVTPSLYIACGISGAIQHKVGMRSSGLIVAINKDANAPIFEFSDLGVVGDIFQIVPELTRLVKERKGAA